MSKDIIKIDKEEFNQEKAIELDGEIFDLPVRTKDLHEKIVELESKRQKMKEFDFYNEIFAVIFGKANAATLELPQQNQTLPGIIPNTVVSREAYMVIRDTIIGK